MSTLNIDAEKLREAVKAMLHPAFGQRRIDTVRGALMGEVRLRTNSEQARKLKYILEVAKQPGGCSRMLDLVQSTEKKLKELQEAVKAKFPSAIKHREKIRENTALYRHRVRTTLLAEDLKRIALGKPVLSASQQKEFLREKQKQWNDRAVGFIERARLEGKSLTQAKAEFARLLDKAATTEYRQAMALVKQEGKTLATGIRRRTATAEKLAALVDKFSN